MTDITESLKAVRASLVANELLMPLLGNDPDNIQVANPEVPDQRNLAAIVDAQEEGTILVAFRGIGMGRRGNVPRYAYHFTLIYRAPGEIGVAGDPDDPSVMSHPGYFELFRATMDGVSIEPELGWYDTQLHENFDPPEFEGFTPATDAKGATYWQFTFSLIEVEVP